LKKCGLSFIRICDVTSFTGRHVATRRRTIANDVEALQDQQPRRARVAQDSAAGVTERQQHRLVVVGRVGVAIVHDEDGEGLAGFVAGERQEDSDRLVVDAGRGGECLLVVRGR